MVLLAGVGALGLASFGGGFAVGSAAGSEDPTGPAAEASFRTPEKGGPIDFRATRQVTYAVGAGMKVTVTGGGAGTSNCTADETNETFTTTRDEEVRTVGFIAKYDGSCFFEKSWSEFGFKVVDPRAGDRVVGTGRGIMVLNAPERLGCQPYIGPARYEWKGLSCSPTEGAQLNIRITPAK